MYWMQGVHNCMPDEGDKHSLSVKGMLYEYGVTIGPSKIRIKTDKKEAIPEAIREVRRGIEALQEYVRRKPLFQYSLEPVDDDPEAPPIAKLMINASRAACVGPMASVAGAIADICLRKLLEMGAEVAVVEDGGEIAAYTSGREIVVSISTNEPSLSGRIGLMIGPRDSPIGIATSTGRVDQRVISFGSADSVTVIADSAAIADAAATSICNAITGSDPRKSIRRGIEKARGIIGVRGLIVSYEGHFGLFGKLPKIVKVK